jgi:putative DNA primase/helicase
VAADRSEMLQQLRQVPQALKDRPQWLMWRLVQKAGAAKPAKLPYYRNGHLRGWPKGKPADGAATDAQPNVEQGHELDRAALVTFDEALDALRSTRWAGIGFAFLPGDGLIGIDIDGAIDADTGEVSQRCRQILAACSSYTEASPSGKGLHVYVEGHTETFKSDDIGVEVYCSAQFFTVTGRRWSDYPATVEPIQPQALQLLRTMVEDAREASSAARAAAKPAGRPQAAPRAVDDFRRVNTMALLSLDAWVPSLFSQARRWRDGWRVSSKALGRTLQEDLQLVPEGIMDFGEEQGYSPIDLVIRWGGASTPKDALQWLASRIGIALQAPKARRTKPTAPEEDPPELEADGSASPPSAGSAEEEEGDEGPPLDVAEAEAAAQADAPSGGPALDATGLGGGKPPRKSKGGGGGGGGRDNVRALLLKTSDGGIKACRENVALCLEHHPALKGLVGFDQFSHQVRKLKPPPWRSEPGEWTTNDDYELGMFLASSPGFTVASESAIVSGVAIAANRHAYHPVRDWFDALPAWDEVERLPFWLSECVGAVESDYTRLVGPWFVMGMVQRVLVPGSQMDYMIVLEGPQGQRKSTALRTLVPRVEWFADTPIRVGDKDALLSLAGKMLTEIGELDSFNRAEVTAVKQYVSSRVDRVREPFARRHVDRPRSGVFAGSTNQHEYFKDPTGARRFWPVATGAIDIDKLTDWRDQLYAEALHRLRSDDPQKRRYYPTREETETYLVPQQEAREIGDPWFERIATWVDSKDSWRNTGALVRQVRCFTSHDILTGALGVPQDRIDGARNMATRVGICMHKLGWAKHRDAAGARLWRYWRPGSTPKDGDGTDEAED